MFTLSLHRVRDTVRIRENDKSLILKVNLDAMRVVAALNDVQRRLKALTEKSPEEEQTAAARAFAETLFGAEQADRLCVFYGNDAACVINICGEYFSRRLSKLIQRAQTK